MVVSQRFVRFMCRMIARKLPYVAIRMVENTDYLADPALSVMAQLHALVANPMTRYVRMENTKSLTRQFIDQGEPRLNVH